MSEYDVAAEAWEAEARKKELPDEFIERLAASDGVTEREKARLVRSVSTAADLAEKRRRAIEHGRLLGEDTATQLREPPQRAADRVARAMAYAAWVFDGKPPSSESQREEFGVGSVTTAGYEDWKKLKP